MRYSRPGIELLESRLLLSTFFVTTTDDSGPGSLRQAILDANKSAGMDTIAFAIGKGGLQTIAPASALPAITAPVVLDGTTQMGFAGRPLIEVTGANAGLGASGLTIMAGQSTVRGLIIHSYGMWGILVQGRGSNLIAGNYVGTDPSGIETRPNRAGGVLVRGESDNNTVGGTTPADRNVVVGSDCCSAVDLSSVRGNRVVGNYVGTDAAGSRRMGAGAAGDVYAAGGSDNAIGGTMPGAGNLVVGAVVVSGSNQVVQGNSIGTDATGTLSLGRGSMFLNGREQLIGGTAPGARNVIAGWMNFGSNQGGIIVQGNYIGTDITGTHLLGRGGGVTVRGQNNLVGGATPGARNIITGFNDFGADPAVNVLGDHNRIQGNYIGTDVTGTVALALGNRTAGIALGDPLFGGGNDNLVGGTEPGAGNLISGNALGVEAAGSRNTIQGNYIGTDATGTRALPNEYGIVLSSIFNSSSNDNLIGGTEPGAGNLVSGNSGTAIGIIGQFNRVQGNLIGVEAGGVVALPNGFRVALNGSDNLLGGSEPGAGNVIAGNRMGGVLVDGDRGLVQGNWIGTDRLETKELGNGEDGVYMASGENTHNLVGGTTPEAGNIIAFNGRDGVRVSHATSNAILGNSIFTNAGLGIALVNGGNNDQAFPDELEAVSDGGFTAVTGMLESTPKTRFAIEWFANSACHWSGYGEGEQFVARSDVKTNSDGVARFDLVLDVDLSGQWLTATATDPDGNTSQFSACTEVQTPRHVAKEPAPSMIAGPAADSTYVSEGILPLRPAIMTPTTFLSLPSGIAEQGPSHGDVPSVLMHFATDRFFARIGQGVPASAWELDESLQSV
jgi:titin